MKISKLNPNELKSAYNILCQPIVPSKNSNPPFGSTLCVVEPGNKTLPHAHSEGEAFLILEGQGKLTVGETEVLVTQGDYIEIPSQNRHVIVNESKRSSLKFLSIYWEDVVTAKDSDNILLYAAPPTPNGDLHLGHISGPYLAADILSRFYRNQGSNVEFICGTDDFQSYVEAKAKEENITPQEVVEKNASAIKRSLAFLQIEPTVFQSPLTNLSYQSFVREFYQCLFQANLLVRESTKAPYCQACDQFLYEVYATGVCPGCERVTAGNGCEECGFPNQVTDLIDLRCAGCEAEPVFKETVRIFFDLSRSKSFLLEFHQRTTLDPKIRGYLERTLDGTLSRIPIAYESEWGIAVPGESHLVFHAWFEMAASYVFSDPNRFKSESRKVLLFGFDNAFYYTLYLPALWNALGIDSERMPTEFITNEFLLLKGEKFSTSRRHAIWARDSHSLGSVSEVRAMLSHFRPEGSRVNFVPEASQKKVELVLTTPLGSLTEQLNHVLETQFQGRIPLVGGISAALHSELNVFFKQVENLEYYLRIESFSPKQALDTFQSLCLRLTRSVGGQPKVSRERMVLTLTAFRYLVRSIAPVLPGLSLELLKAMGETSIMFSAKDLVQGGEVVIFPTDFGRFEPAELTNRFPYLSALPEVTHGAI